MLMEWVSPRCGAGFWYNKTLRQGESEWEAVWALARRARAGGSLAPVMSAVGAIAGASVGLAWQGRVGQCERCQGEPELEATQCAGGIGGRASSRRIQPGL